MCLVSGNALADAGMIKFFSGTGLGARQPERLRIDASGNIGVNTTVPTAVMDINGATGYNQLRLRSSYTPTATADANGSTGDITWDDNFFYIKTAAGWKRSALTTF